MWTIPPPGKLRKLTPQNVHLVCFGALLPGYPASFHEETAKELKIKGRQNLDGEEGDSPILSNELKALQARISLGQSRPRPGEEARRRAGMLLKAFRSLPLEDDELAELIEPELAIADYQDSCRIADSRQNVRAPFRQPLIQTAFPAVDSARGIGFIGRWQVFAPHQQHKKGRAAFALSSPGSEFGCWAVNCLPDARTREGFHRAVRAARELASAKLGRAELDDLIVWLEPEPALALTERVQRDDLPCLWDQTQDLSGASGSLALAVALLQAWTGERLDLRDLLITGDVTDDGQIASVGEANYKTALESGSKRTLHGFFSEVGAVPNTQAPKTLKDYWQGLLDSPERQRGGIQKMLNYLEHLHKGSLPNSAFPTSTINFVKVTKVEKKIEKPNSEEKDPDSGKKNSKKAKTDDFEQDEITEGEDSVRLGFAEFSQLVKQTAYSQAQHPVVLTAGPGMGKTFASCRLAIEQCREWLKSDPLSANLKPALPLWVSLSQIKSLTPEALFESAVSTLSLNSVERQGLKKAFDSESLLVVLDARDQGDSVAVKDAVKKLCDELLASRQTGRSIHVVITTRPIRRGEVWADFGGWQKDCFELRQAEFDRKSLERFVQVRAMGNEKVAAAVITAAKNPKGRSARLTVPVIAEFTTHLCLTDGQGFADKLEEGISGFDLYDALTDSLIRQGITACGLTGSGLLPLKIKQCIGWMCARLWEENPGRNAYKEEDCQMLLLQAHQIAQPACSTDDLLLVLSKSGIYEAFLLHFRQVCFVHRSLLEFLRAWWMKRQYMLSPQGNWEGTSPFFDWPLGRLVDRKAWDDQWHETFCFFASFLADYRGEGGRWLVPFLKRIEADDYLIYSRLNLALKCVRQAWFLYEESREVAPHRDVLDWCLQKRSQIENSELDYLLTFRFAVWYKPDLFQENDVQLLYSSVNLWEPKSCADQVLAVLSNRLNLECSRDEMRCIYAIKHWSVSGYEALLQRLFLYFNVWGFLNSTWNEHLLFRSVVIKVIGVFSSNGSEPWLICLISKLEEERDWETHVSLLEAIGQWYQWGSESLFERLIFAILKNRSDTVHYMADQFISSWFDHGSANLLSRIIENLDPNFERSQRYFLSKLVSRLTHFGNTALLGSVISQLEESTDEVIVDSLSMVVYHMSDFGSASVLDRLLSRLEAKPATESCYSLVFGISSLSKHGDLNVANRMFRLFEDETDSGVRCSLAVALWSFSACGNESHLNRLITFYEAEQDSSSRHSLAHSIGYWEAHGSEIILDRLISSMLVENDHEIRADLASGLGRYSSTGNSSLLIKMISGLEHEKNEGVHRFLSFAVGCWSQHGTEEILERLTVLFEKEANKDFKQYLAEVIGHFSAFGSEGYLTRLVYNLIEETERNVLEGLKESIEKFSVYGSNKLLEDLIFSLEERKGEVNLDNIVEVLASLSSFGNETLLERVFALMEDESDAAISREFFEFFASWHQYGNKELLSRMIERLIQLVDGDRRFYYEKEFLNVFGLWSVHVDAQLIDRLVGFLSATSGNGRGWLAKLLLNAQTGPEGPRRFLAVDHPYFSHPSRRALAERGVVLVSELTDMYRDD